MKIVSRLVLGLALLSCLIGSADLLTRGGGGGHGGHGGYGRGGWGRGGYYGGGWGLGTGLAIGYGAGYGYGDGDTTYITNNYDSNNCYVNRDGLTVCPQDKCYRNSKGEKVCVVQE